MALLLGFSYFFVQAYLFQILNLKLSSPIQSFSLLLFVFLLGNGLGSLTTKLYDKALPRKLMMAALAIIIVNLLTVFALLPILGANLSKAGIVVALILPSFFIGMPFPLLLKMAAEYRDKNAIPIVLGVSSVAGVAASVFANVISISSGYQMVFLLGLSGYGALVLVTNWYRVREKKVKLYPVILK